MARFYVFTIIFMTFFIGCNEDAGTNSIKPTFSEINSDVLSLRCAKSGCHLDSQTPLMRSSDAAFNYLALVNVTNPTTGLKYIRPNFPDSSYLYLKIIADGTRRQGSRMPRDGASNGFLPDSQIDTIREWIEDGAQNN
jgi:hypothetical protein